jgi:hypothetical protein
MTSCAGLLCHTSPSSACISCDGYGGCAWLLGVIYVELRLVPFFQGTLNAKGPQDLPFSCTKQGKEKNNHLNFLGVQMRIPNITR